MRKNALNRPRVPFRLTCEPEISRPRKASYLEEAAGHLGPFRYQTDVEATAASAVFNDGQNEFALSKESAERLVTTIAATFNTETYLAHRAPRLKNVFSDLDKLNNAIEALSKQLRSLNDVTLHELRCRDEAVTLHHTDILPNMDIALTQALPRPANDSSAAVEHSWLDRLSALADHAEFTKRRVQIERQKRGRSCTDIGGNTNLYKEAMGNPKWGLVFDCLSLFDAFKPDEASGYAEGPFNNFVMDVFEYATGQPSDTAGVQDWVKQLVRANRELKAIREEKRPLYDALLEGEKRREFDSDEGMQRWLELKRQLEVLTNSETDVAKRLWPH